MTFLDVPGEQACRLPRTVLNRKGTRNPEGIEAVQIAAGRKYFGVAQQIAAGCWPDESSIQRAQERRDFVIVAEQHVNGCEFPQQ